VFTGIIETTGELLARERTTDGVRLRLAAPFAGELDHGQSVAVSGACLTVEETTDDSFTVFLAEETVEVTYLGDLAVGERVNLERALPAEGRFDGHVVQGHVDGVGEVTGIEQVGGEDGDWYFEFTLPDSMGRYVVSKGSITIDGISLTVADLDGERVAVAVIPATYEITTLSEKSVGDPVHLEVDVIAKYVESITEQYA